MLCKVCGSQVGSNSVQVNIWGRRVFPCKCGVCYEYNGSIAKSQSDSRKIICWEEEIRVDRKESEVFTDNYLIGLCVEDDKEWLMWKGLIGA